MSRAIKPGQRLVVPNEEALEPEPMTSAGPQPWHAEAIRLRSEGFSLREIARAVGRTFGPVQRFFNPESRAKQKRAQNEHDKERRASDPEYAESSRTYRRRYAQHRAPERWKPGARPGVRSDGK